MKQILDGYARIFFQYIKELVDQSEKNQHGYMLSRVINGLKVINNIYTLTLCYSQSTEKAIDSSNKAIHMYIDFITQLYMMDSNTNNGFKLGTNDANQFVYKKLLTNIETLSPPQEKINSPNIKSHEEFSKNMSALHEYKRIFFNMVISTFKKDKFYDYSSDTCNYYSDVINNLLRVNSVLEKLPNIIITYKNIVLKQEDMQQYTETMDYNEYSHWLISVITNT
jgi:hypothetical protein